MKNQYIEKFKMENFSIGSFDAYFDDVVEMISKKSNCSREEALEFLKKIPSTLRAAIVDDTKKELVGYIGLMNIDNVNSKAELVCEIISNVSNEKQEKIKRIFYNWVNQCLNIKNITNEENLVPNDIKNTAAIKSTIILSQENISDGISEENLKRVNEWFDSKINLSYPCSVTSKDGLFLGVIGLSNLIWSNRRANLSLYLNPQMTEDMQIVFGSKVIDQYLSYVHDLNIHNVATSIDLGEKLKKEMFDLTGMSLFAEIPFSSLNKDNNMVESKVLYQHINNLEKTQIGLNKEQISQSIIMTAKDKMDSVIEIEDGYKLVSPLTFAEENINREEIVAGHILAMQNREKFSIPLGEDKFILQKGNDKYGVCKFINDFNYIVVDRNGKYAGFVNILRNSLDLKNAEIEIGIAPESQHIGLGKKVIKTFYNELFSIGYASVTSVIFDFNKPSLAFHEKVADYNGVRLESYYINGKLWDINYFTRINPKIIESLNKNNKSR